MAYRGHKVERRKPTYRNFTNTFIVQAVIFKGSSFILNIAAVRKRRQVVCARPGGTGGREEGGGAKGAGSCRGCRRRHGMLCWRVPPSTSSGTPKGQLFASPVAVVGSDLAPRMAAKGLLRSTRCRRGAAVLCGLPSRARRDPSMESLAVP